jgi:hypothetical protein
MHSDSHVTSTDSDPLTAPDGQPGVDATARLLMALTSLYVQRPVHTAEEQRQYTELALRLIDKAGPETRAAVIARLQPHPDAPAEVIGRLTAPPRSDDDSRSAGEPDAAGPQTPHSQGEADCAGAEQEGTTRPRDAAPAGPPPAAVTPEFSAAFFAASPEERRRLLSLVAPRDGTETVPENGRRFHVRIDATTWGGRTGAFARDLARLIDAPDSLCERILNDPTGEPMVVAAKATGMPVAILQRILLLLSPVVSHPVDRVYELTDLYHDLDGRVARDLLALWRSVPIPDGAAAAAGPETEHAVPVTNLRTRFRALSARIPDGTITGQRGRESDAPRDLPSR